MISVLMKGGVNRKAKDHDDKDDYVSSSPEAVSTSSSDNDDYDDDSTSTYSSDGSKKKMSGNNDDNHNNVDNDTAQQLAATPTVVVNESLMNLYITNSINVYAQYQEHDKVEDEEDGILILQQEEDEEEDSYVVLSSLYKRCSTETKPPLKMIATRRSTTSSLYEDLPRPTRSAYSPSSSSSSNKFDIWRKEKLFNFKSFYNDLYGGGGSSNKHDDVKLV